MSLYKQFYVSEQKEIEGVEVKIYDACNDDGTIPTFILSRMGRTNKRYTKALEAAARPYRRQSELGVMDNDKAEEILMNVFVDSVLRGWEHVQDRKGKEVKFTKEAAIGLFKDLPDLFDRLQEEAKQLANFRDDALEAEAKN